MYLTGQQILYKKSVSPKELLNFEENIFAVSKKFRKASPFKITSNHRILNTSKSQPISTIYRFDSGPCLE
jgi:hypothetical protein